MKNFILKILREPIVQFGLLASLLLYVDINRNPDDYKNSNYQIMIDDNILINFMQQRAKIFNPDEAINIYQNLAELEKKKLMTDFFHQEALYREALINNFDKNDPIIKRRLVQKVDYLSQGFYDEVSPISRRDLENYFEKNKENYRKPALITFTHVFLKDKNKVDDTTLRRAEALMETLNEKVILFEESGLYGERFLYNRNYVNRESSEIESHFGEQFKNAVFAYSSSKLEKSAWIGPIQSDYGWHLVLITQISDSYTPTLNSVEADVRGDLYREEQFASKMRRLNQVKAKYELIDQTDSYD